MTDIKFNENNNELPIYQKLNLETAVIKWKDLQVYFAQGKLLIIDNVLDLIEIATLIADNKTDDIKQLVEAEKISFATADWVKTNAKEQTELWAVVVSPYVICQLKLDS